MKLFFALKNGVIRYVEVARCRIDKARSLLTNQWISVLYLMWTNTDYSEIPLEDIEHFFCGEHAEEQLERAIRAKLPKGENDEFLELKDEVSEVPPSVWNSTAPEPIRRCSTCRYEKRDDKDHFCCFTNPNMEESNNMYEDDIPCGNWEAKV